MAVYPTKTYSVNGVDHRRCPKCEQSKTVNEFYKFSVNRARGRVKRFHPYCKICHRLLVSQRHKTPHCAEAKRVYRKNSKHKRRAQRKGGNVSLKEWNAIKSNQKNKCYWCRKKLKNDKLTMDHVIPLNKGGEHNAGNIVAACSYCNSSKGVKMWSIC